MSPAAPRLDFAFPPPERGTVDAIVIAGEHSGDEHAARMVAEARRLRPDLEVAALGGRRLREAGAQLLFDMTAHSVVGFFEALKYARLGLRLANELVSWIRRHQPRAVVLVDYPGFNLHLAKRLNRERLAAKSGGPVKLLYYISPQVWAWKAARRFRMAERLDALAVIFPFEEESFADTSLDVRFVGHPFMAEDYELPARYHPDGPVLLLPGSRSEAVGRIAPVLLDAFQACLRRKAKLEAVCLCASEALADDLRALLARRPALEGRVRLVASEERVEARAVLASSGTMSLNCALAGIPGAIVYRAHPWTALLARMYLKVPYIGIANLLLGRAMYPEYLQGRARPGPLADELVACMERPERIRETRRLAAELRGLLDQPRNGGAGAWLVERATPPPSG